ncbi:uncharacterized protein LOC110977921 [Acanthaster planci]|uniref:Uncharacterized protein LOC110977921 n=1 Tax=Acanthaster planci TaxID=133434 RepID=A0A8B7Y4N0_ACAPL|nr:uncharacterized protein LOC110977921 [Acanthaster planci]XP_022088148.1 uncharacterized protein LOC110977921 [Acanthaster planci]XP_022088149.1 uncharacterized protein LOC110977921 [Acanthaster planci]XP_022088150.1 uncharacterized protein LOC110977921 [Acanthaster planci]
MSGRQSVTGRNPDDQLKERARILQLLKDSNPEFSAKRRNYASPASLPRNDFPMKRPSPPSRGPPPGTTWSQERHRLAKENQKLQEEHQQVMQAQKRWSLPSPYTKLEPIGTRPHSSEEHWKEDLANFVLKTQDQLPAMIANLQKMKEELEREKKEVVNRDFLLAAPKSYKPWQMADYYLVRDFLLDLVDDAVEISESKPKPQPLEEKLEQQVAVATEREVEAARQQQSQERALQLLAEELVLETTNAVSRQTAEEYLSTEHYALSLKRQLVMQSAEAAATGNPSGRAEEDPAYDLVTSTYEQMTKDRNMNRKDIWAHSQRLHLQPTVSNPEQDVVVESLAPDDAVRLNLLHLPVRVGRPPDPQSPEMKQFKDQESAYWKLFAVEQVSVSLAKKVQGVVTAVMSPHQRYLALGCLRGDVLVYNVSTGQPLPIRCIQNESAQTDAVIHIAWSLDSSRLITVNETGILQVWSMSSGGVSQKDVRDLEVKTQTGLPAPSQLTQLLALDADRSDFNFKEGPLKETGAQTSAVSPKMAVFHPTHTLLATQNTVVIGLENGDILKCNVSASPDAVQQQMATASHSVVTLDTQANYIGENVPVELCRCHKSALIFLGFASSHGNMVSMDTSGLICEWHCSRETFSHFGWFQPSAKYQLELAEGVYAPRPDDAPKVHFNDTDLAEKKMSRQERLAAREKAQQRLDKLPMGILWHQEMNTSSTLLQIYRPEEVQEAGSVFHGIVRHATMDQLLKHYTYYCQPAKNFCSRVLQVCQSASGRTLVLMLLFPAFSPKGPHITFVSLNLKEMSIDDMRIDVSLSEDEYDWCLNDDICSFGLTPVVAATGTPYLIAGILGTVHVFSMETASEVMSAGMEALGGSKAKKLAERLSLSVSTSMGNINILSYAAKHNSVDMLQLVDKNLVKPRRRVYESYLNWKGRKSDVPPEQQHRHRVWTMDNDTDRNVELYARRLVLQLADIAVYMSERLNVDANRLKQFWKEDKINAESDLLQRILDRRRGNSTAVSDACE